jgi:hypothetical protein
LLSIDVNHNDAYMWRAICGDLTPEEDRRFLPPRYSVEQLPPVERGLSKFAPRVVVIEVSTSFTVVVS